MYLVLEVWDGVLGLQPCFYPFSSLWYSQLMRIIIITNTTSVFTVVQEVILCIPLPSASKEACKMGLVTIIISIWKTKKGRLSWNNGRPRARGDEGADRGERRSLCEEWFAGFKEGCVAGGRIHGLMRWGWGRVRNSGARQAPGGRDAPAGGSEISAREQGAHNRHSPEAWRVLGKEQPKAFWRKPCTREHLKFLLEGRARTVFLLFWSSRPSSCCGAWSPTDPPPQSFSPIAFWLVRSLAGSCGRSVTDPFLGIFPLRTPRTCVVCVCLLS